MNQKLASLRRLREFSVSFWNITDKMLHVKHKLMTLANIFHSNITFLSAIFIIFEA